MGKGYCIKYEGAERYPVSTRKKSDVRNAIGMILLMIAITISLVVPKAKKSLISFLIPGNDHVTVQAAEELAARLQSGENTTESLEVFCRRILDNGE